MNYKSLKNRAFTLIELLVAIGILAVILSFASVIFRVSIGAHRMAVANAERTDDIVGARKAVKWSIHQSDISS